MVINGDVTQIDLQKSTSGLIMLKLPSSSCTNMILFYFDSKDVVRTSVVASINRSYDEKKRNLVNKQVVIDCS